MFVAEFGQKLWKDRGIRWWRVGCHCCTGIQLNLVIKIILFISNILFGWSIELWSASCTDYSLLMPHPWRILQKYTTFGESNTHSLTFLICPTNIDDLFYLSIRINLSKFQFPFRRMTLRGLKHKNIIYILLGFRVYILKRQ